MTAPFAPPVSAATAQVSSTASGDVCEYRGIVSSQGPRRRGFWKRLLIDVEYGLKWGFRSDSTLVVHMFLICIVLLGGFLLGFSPLQWGVIVVAICSTLAAEMFRTVILTLVASLDSSLSATDSPLTLEARQTPRVATAAVFLTLLGSTTACTLIFATRIHELLQKVPPVQ